MLREPWGSTAVPDETHRSSKKCFVQLTSSCYPSRNAVGLVWWSLGFWRIATLAAPPYIDRHLARMCQYPSSWMVSLLATLPATRVFCVSVSAVGGGSLLSPEGEKVNGGNLYPLSNAGQMQILCWLSCCAMCWQGGLTVSPSLLFGRVVRSSVAARFFSFKQGSRSTVFFWQFHSFY